MKEMFFGGLAVFIILFSVKAVLTLVYWKQNNSRSESLTSIDQGLFTVVQPILAGDPSLYGNLEQNLKNLKQCNFVWVIDETDTEAHCIIEAIFENLPQDINRVKILEVGPIPPGLNPKVYKLECAMPYLSKYTIVLDDDAVIEDMPYLIDKLEAGFLITGIPFYKCQHNILSNLVTAFVNSNSIFTYFPMSMLSQPKTINGMFYITKTQVLQRLDAFNKIKDKLCDDYEIAKLYRNNGFPLFQSTISCGITTTVQDFIHYQRLMKRWMVFAKQFLQENLTLSVWLIVIIPSFLPVLILASSLLMGLEYVLLYFAVHGSKVIIYSLIRKALLKNEEGWTSPMFEFVSDYLQMVHFIHASLSPHKIQWRNRTIEIDKGKVGIRG